MNKKSIASWLFPIVYLIILSMEFKVNGYAWLKIIINILFIILAIVLMVSTRLERRADRKSNSNITIGRMMVLSAICVGVLLAVVYLAQQFKAGRITL